MAKKPQVKKKAAVKKPPAKAKKAAPAKAKPAPAKTKKAAPVAKRPAAKRAAQASAAAPHQQSVIPHLVVRGASHAIEFYRRAFGAKEVMRMPSPDGYGIMHADLTISGSHLFLCDEMPQMGTCKSPQSLGGTPCTITIYVADADQIYNQAVEAGATATMPLADMFWGDRYGKVLDPFGHEWAIAAHQEDVPPAEMQRRFEAMAKGQGG